MNEIGARAIRCGMRFVGQFRRVHRSAWETVEKDGAPVLYYTEDAAKVAAWEALAASGHLTSIMRRDGWTINESARAAAEKLFTREAAYGESLQEKEADATGI